MLTSADDFLRPPVRRTVQVRLPVRGDVAIVRGLLVVEGVKLADDLRAASGLDLIAIQLAAYLCDEAGNSILSIAQAKAAVNNIEAQDARAILEAGVKLNSVDDTGVEEAAKN